MSPSPARVRGTIAAAVAQPEDLRQLRAFHKVMADVNRLRIVRRLADGEATVDRADRPRRPVPAARRPGTSAGSAPPASSRPAASGRETICRLREEAFDEFAARERAVLGLAS